MIEQLIKKVFMLRHIAHIHHFKTDSYSQHMALGDFYDAIIEQADTIVEVLQGYFGVLIKVTAFPQTDIPADITEALRNDLEWIIKQRSVIAKNVAFIENEIDGLCSIYARAIYKLERLK